MRLPPSLSLWPAPHSPRRAHWPPLVPTRHRSLEPFEQAIQHRSASRLALSLLPTFTPVLTRPLLFPPPRSTDVYSKWRATIDEHEGGLDKFSRGYDTFGLHQLDNGDIRYREWAPNATSAALTGDFSALSPSLSLKSPSFLPHSHRLTCSSSYRRVEPRGQPDDQGLVRRVGVRRPRRQGPARHPAQLQDQGAPLLLLASPRRPSSSHTDTVRRAADLDDDPERRAHRASPRLGQVRSSLLRRAPSTTH